jgi:putative tryptophan/tyrosine transport system substrate-binding protein
MKLLTRLSAIMFAVVLIISIACNHEHSDSRTEKLVVAITPLSHPSLQQSFEGFVQGLNEKGYDQSRVKIETLNANGNFAAIPSLVKNAVARKPAAIFVVTTPACAEAVKITNPAGIPLLYTAVTDPISAKIVTAMDRSDTLATGVSDRYPVDAQMRLVRSLLPTMSKAALLYNPAEENSQILVRQSIDALTKMGVQSKRYEVHNASEIPSQAKQAIDANDCVIVNGDNLVIENLSTVANICRTNKKPLFVGDPDSVRKGAIATVGPSYFDIGRRTGHKAAEVLNGKSPKEIPSEFPVLFDYIINTEAAKSMGLNIPAEFWASRGIWESRSSSKEP